MGTNCAPLLDKLFLYSYEADFIHWLLKKSEKKLARSSNFTCRCIDDALSLNNSKFGDFVDRIHPIELEIKDKQIHLVLLHTLTYTSKLTLRTGLRTKFYAKRNDFNFPIGIFSYISIYIPAAPLYGVQGRIQDFKLGGGAVKKIAQSGGMGENFLGYFM